MSHICTPSVLLNDTSFLGGHHFSGPPQMRSTEAQADACCICHEQQFLLQAPQFLIKIFLHKIAFRPPLSNQVVTQTFIW
jgi:hypothetical protein